MNIFITGGTTGIGLSLAKYYLQNGHRVGICGRNKEKFHQAFSQCPPKLFFYEVDVVEREKLAHAMKEFAQHGLDLVIANAGIASSDKKSIPDFERARKIIDINIHGVLNTFEPAMEIMMKKDGPERGHLVAVSSVAGMAGLPGTGAYCASKAAVLKFCETLSIDLISQGIHVTTIAPGFVDTPLTQKNHHPMPFLVTAEKAAVLISKAIQKKKVLYIFPQRMKFIITILYHLPRCLYVAIMRKIGPKLTGKAVKI